MCKAVNIDGVAVKASFISRVCVGGKIKKIQLLRQKIMDFTRNFLVQNIMVLRHYFHYVYVHVIDFTKKIILLLSDNISWNQFLYFQSIQSWKPIVLLIYEKSGPVFQLLFCRNDSNFFGKLLHFFVHDTLLQK